MMRAHTVLGLLLLSLGCTAEEPAHTRAEELGTAGGSFALTSTFDISAVAALPENAYSVVELVSELDTAPGKALLHVLEETGHPALKVLLVVLPGPLKDALAGYIDDAVKGVLATNPQAHDALTTLEQTIFTALFELELQSELELGTPDESGVAQARHRVQSLVFPPGGPDAVAVPVAAPAPAGDVPVTASVQAASVNGLTLSLGEHRFGLPYGQVLFEAIDTWLAGQTGDDARGLLEKALPCNAIAAQVAAQCAGLLCVGHEAELETACEAGLDQIHAQLEDAVGELRLDALVLHQGRSTLKAQGPDRSLADGVWDAEVNFGQGLRRTAGRYTGTEE